MPARLLPPNGGCGVADREGAAPGALETTWTVSPSPVTSDAPTARCRGPVDVSGVTVNGQRAPIDGPGLHRDGEPLLPLGPLADVLEPIALPGVAVAGDRDDQPPVGPRADRPRAGALEDASEHPIARAIAAGARERVGALPTVDGFTNLEGLGVHGVVDGHAVVAGRERLLADWAMPLTAELRAARPTAAAISVSSRLTGGPPASRSAS